MGGRKERRLPGLSMNRITYAELGVVNSFWHGSVMCRVFWFGRQEGVAVWLSHQKVDDKGRERFSSAGTEQCLRTKSVHFVNLQ